MPISNTALRERPAKRSAQRERTPSERASAISRNLESTGVIRRPAKSQPARRKDRKRPIRLLVGAGVYTLALATITVAATELITNASDQQDLAATPTVAQLPSHVSTHVPIYGPTVAPAPAAPSSTPTPAPAPVLKPVNKAGRVAARTRLTASTSSNDSVWNKLAACESSGRWSVNTGNGYYGGLQFKQSTWVEYGGRAYAPRANEASKADQIAVASKVLAGQGWRAWPSCSRKTGVNQIPVSSVVDGQPTPPATTPASAVSSKPAPAKPTPPSTIVQPTPSTTQPAPTTQPTPPSTSPAPTTSPVTTSPTPAPPATPSTGPTLPVSTQAPPTHQDASGSTGSTQALACLNGSNDLGSLASCLAEQGGGSGSANGLIRWAQSSALSPPAGRSSGS